MGEGGSGIHTIPSPLGYVPELTSDRSYTCISASRVDYPTVKIVQLFNDLTDKHHRGLRRLQSFKMHCNLAVALLLQYTGYLILDVLHLEVN